MTDDVDQPAETYEQRRERRIAELPAVYRRNDERMALELVLLDAGADPWDVFATYGYSREAALETLGSSAFTRLLEAARKDINENGAGFRAKARMQAEALLVDSYEIATDPMASAAVRAQLIQWTAKMAGYEPKDDKDGKGAGGGFNLFITFPGQAQQAVVTHEPVTLEAER